MEWNTMRDDDQFINEPGTNNQEQWDSSLEKINLREDVQWFENNINKKIIYEKLLRWMKKGPEKLTVDDETNFVNAEVLRNVIQTKYDVFNEFDVNELRRARARANVFETIRNGIFMNRAALKMANIDAVTEFMFTKLDYDLVHKGNGPYYFADVCAGPGGFTEYILWRKNWCYKGFGFTLKDEHDFKLNDSTCISPNSFRSYYGSSGDGNIYNPDNMNDFKEIVLQHTGVGVHFMMSDGGFSVEGNENLQEILSKQIYVCQCLMALEIVRPHGYFVTKLFDLFTTFSVGLIYLMHLCFEKFTIIKPNSSRPANSERYLICKNLQNTRQTAEIRKYLRDVVKDLWAQQQSQDRDSCILELIPLGLLQQHTKFVNYMHQSNTTIAERQIIGLSKLKFFCRHPHLTETRQEIYRSKCLNLWGIPDRKRNPIQTCTIDDIINTISRRGFMLTPPKEICDIVHIRNIIADIDDWRFVSLTSSKSSNSCHIFVGTSNSKVSKLVRNKWIKIKNIKLNKGTLLFGEIVREKCISVREGSETEKLSLHVIDALRLGETSLADLPFQERIKSIQIFCKAINFESEQKNFRIRTKLAKPLDDLYTTNAIEYNKGTSEYVTNLSVLGPQNSNEHHSVNSLLFLKSNAHQTFYTTYVLRAIVNISEHEIIGNSFKLVDIIDQIKNFNKG